MYDVCSKIYIDTIIQKSRNSNENRVLIDMLIVTVKLMLLLLLLIEATNPITHLHTSKKKVGNFFFESKIQTVEVV